MYLEEEKRKPSRLKLVITYPYDHFGANLHEIRFRPMVGA